MLVVLPAPFTPTKSTTVGFATSLMPPERPSTARTRSASSRSASRTLSASPGSPVSNPSRTRSRSRFDVAAPILVQQDFLDFARDTAGDRLLAAEQRAQPPEEAL